MNQIFLRPMGHGSYGLEFTIFLFGNYFKKGNYCETPNVLYWDRVYPGRLTNRAILNNIPLFINYQQIHYVNDINLKR